MQGTPYRRSFRNHKRDESRKGRQTSASHQRYAVPSRDPGEWSVVDGNGKPVRTSFETRELAQAWIENPDD